MKLTFRHEGKYELGIRALIAGKVCLRNDLTQSQAIGYLAIARESQLMVQKLVSSHLIDIRLHESSWW